MQTRRYAFALRPAMAVLLPAGQLGALARKCSAPGHLFATSRPLPLPVCQRWRRLVHASSSGIGQLCLATCCALAQTVSAQDPVVWLFSLPLYNGAERYPVPCTPSPTVRSPAGLLVGRHGWFWRLASCSAFSDNPPLRWLPCACPLVPTSTPIAWTSSPIEDSEFSPSSGTFCRTSESPGGHGA